MTKLFCLLSRFYPGWSGQMLVIKKTAQEKTASDGNVENSQIMLGNRGILAEKYSHGYHHQDKRVACPLLESKNANLNFRVISDTLDVVVGKPAEAQGENKQSQHDTKGCKENRCYKFNGLEPNERQPA